MSVVPRTVIQLAKAVGNIQTRISEEHVAGVRIHRDRPTIRVGHGIPSWIVASAAFVISGTKEAVGVAKKSIEGLLVADLGCAYRSPPDVTRRIQDRRPGRPGIASLDRQGSIRPRHAPCRHLPGVMFLDEFGIPRVHQGGGPEIDPRKIGGRIELTFTLENHHVEMAVFIEHSEFSPSLHVSVSNLFRRRPAIHQIVKSESDDRWLIADLEYAVWFAGNPEISSLHHLPIQQIVEGPLIISEMLASQAPEKRVY